MPSRKDARLHRFILILTAPPTPNIEYSPEETLYIEGHTDIRVGVSNLYKSPGFAYIWVEVEEVFKFVQRSARYLPKSEFLKMGGGGGSQ